MPPDIHTDSYEDAIREKTLCGTCEACDLMIWEPDTNPVSGRPENIPDGDLPNGAAASRSGTTIHYHYLIRCRFYRFTVSRPENLTRCTSYKQARR